MVDADTLQSLMAEITDDEGVAFTVNLEDQLLTTPGGMQVAFELDGFRKHNLLNGLDDIGLTLQHTDRIDQFEAQHKQQFPWLWVG